VAAAVLKQNDAKNSNWDGEVFWKIVYVYTQRSIINNQEVIIQLYYRH